jgi:hypothetical protein
VAQGHPAARTAPPAAQGRLLASVKTTYPNTAPWSEREKRNNGQEKKIKINIKKQKKEERIAREIKARTTKTAISQKK